MIGVAIAFAAKDYFYPMNGSVDITSLSVTWADTGEEFSGYEWGIVNNSEATLMEAPLNITNIGNTDATLSLGTQDLSGTITDLVLAWNYTGATLTPQDWVIVELTQTVTATGPWSYTMVITATEA